MERDRRKIRKRADASGRRGHCVDCFWLEMKIDFDGSANYSCLKRVLSAGAPVLWGDPCGDFVLGGSIHASKS